MFANTPKSAIGVSLLLVVHIVWVGTSEVTKYLFADLNFKRPLFVTFIKSIMWTLFMVPYALRTYSKNRSSRMNGSVCVSSCYCRHKSLCFQAKYAKLTTATDDGSEDEEDGDKAFSSHSKADELPPLLRSLGGVAILDSVKKSDSKAGRFLKKAMKSDVVRYMLYFAPTWMMGSLLGQAALVFTSVSTSYLINASSPLFVLIFGTFLSRNIHDQFSFTKLLLVLINFGGVAVVSKFSASILGSALNILATMVNALYLTAVSAYTAKHGKIDMDLMIGVSGLFTLFASIPSLYFAHVTGVEPQLPPPTSWELFLVCTNCFIGSVLMDYLWLYATVLTNSFISSLSITLSIPLSMLADAFFRKQPPHTANMIASVPIMMSFIGASFITTATEPTSKALSAASIDDAEFSDDDEKAPLDVHSENL
ncbi:Drug/metabolite transporter [Aphelenchoides avenae]|nr:Drug/metabolite transporter [Aphelenchus avenae]